ncbi:ASCH domain-containing protein [Kitasatospora sp. NPDC088779]|uniref:ASCH domain-containing protein n=1 Tax=Kitasatospora sp. NPDC088779 TaxID=3154964 RepID=UPI00342107E2
MRPSSTGKPSPPGDRAGAWPPCPFPLRHGSGTPPHAGPGTRHQDPPPYLDLIAGGTKTVGVRVGYPSMRKIHPGQLLVFESGDARYRARVTEVVEYPGFDAMLDAEDLEVIGSEGVSRAELLAAYREIHPLEKERLGVLAIHLRLAP